MTPAKTADLLRLAEEVLRRAHGCAPGAPCEARHRLEAAEAVLERVRRG